MRKLAAIWGVSGIFILLTSAMYRLSIVSIEAFTNDYTFEWYHWLILVAIIPFMIYSEGYKGFQKAFSPRVLARAIYLKQHANPIQGLLAPFFCMAYFHSTKKRMLTSWCLTMAIIAFIVIIKFLPQPIRGVIDVGVLCGLGYGIITLIYFSFKAVQSDNFNISPELPDTANSMAE